MALILVSIAAYLYVIYQIDDLLEREGVQYTCCTDGLRPVVFKVEYIDEKDLPAVER